MTEPKDPTVLSPVTAQSAAISRLYLALFGIQTIGALILLWNGIPLYRQFLAAPGSHEPQVQTLVWGLSSIALIQIGYWSGVRLRPPLPRLRNALLGTVVLFIARISFVFATSVFSVLFITQRSEAIIPVLRYVATLIGLFSLYCYVQEVERLGRTLLGR